MTVSDQTLDKATFERYQERYYSKPICKWRKATLTEFLNDKMEGCVDIG
jgi:hypothetical protein